MRIISAMPIVIIAALASCSQRAADKPVVQEPSSMEIVMEGCHDFQNVARLFDDSDISSFAPQDMMVYHFRPVHHESVDSVRLVPVSRRGYDTDFRIHAFCNGHKCDITGNTIRLNALELRNLDIMVEYTGADMDRREYYRDTIPYVIELESVNQSRKVAFSGMEFYKDGRMINEETILSLDDQAKVSAPAPRIKSLYVSKVDGSLLNRKVSYTTADGSCVFKIFDNGDFSVLNNGTLSHGILTEPQPDKLELELQLMPEELSYNHPNLYINGHDIAVPAIGMEARYDAIDSDLINLKCFGDLFMFDIKYASSDNFTHSKLYPEPICWLRYVAACDLMEAARFFLSQGVMIKMFDGYRPHRMQYLMWEVCPNPNFLSPPSVGSIHNRGGAVDLTLVYPDGRELDMGTPYDFCGPEAYTTNTNLPDSVLENRALLINNITRFHFNKIRTEWWHFSHSMARAYGLCEFVPQEFIDFGKKTLNN